MKKKNKILILLIIWVIYIISDYYILPYFFKPIVWLGICLVLLTLSLRQMVKLFKERRKLTFNSSSNLLLFLSLFFFTFYKFNKIPNSIVEKTDWAIFYDKRNQIVNQIKKGMLQPKTEMNNGICNLPFDFPIISNDGNDVWIFKNPSNNSKTVKFWISRGFFESPQIYFIFTNDIETEKNYQKLIKDQPEHNWKLEDNWYRIMERY